VAQHVQRICEGMVQCQPVRRVRPLLHKGSHDQRGMS